MGALLRALIQYPKLPKLPKCHIKKSTLTMNDLTHYRGLQSSSQGDDDLRSIFVRNDANQAHSQGQLPLSDPALTRLSASTASTSQYFSAPTQTGASRGEVHPQPPDLELVRMERGPPSHSTVPFRLESSSDTHESG